MVTATSSTLKCTSLAFLLSLQGVSVAAQDSVVLTPWQMHAGNDATLDDSGMWQISPYFDAERPSDCEVTQQHGRDCLYDAADVPSANDDRWNDPPDVNVIGMSKGSLLCDAPVKCMEYLDFTYFQAFLDVPENCVIEHFTIDFDGMDDGSRVSVNGEVVPDSYVYLHQSGTADLKDIVKPGQNNRIVITQVDDCCKENNLEKAVVTLRSSCEALTCASVPDICTHPEWVDAPGFDEIVCSGDQCTAATCCLPGDTCKDVKDSLTCDDGFGNSLTDEFCEMDTESSDSCKSICCIPLPSPSPSTTPSTTPSSSPSTSVEPSPSVTPSTSVAPSPSVSPSTSMEPTPSVSPSTSMEPSPSASPSTSIEPSPSSTPSSEPSSSPSPSVEASPSSTPSSSVEPTPSASASPSTSTVPSSSPSSEPSASPQPSTSCEPSASASPEPSESPKPSDSPKPSHSPNPSDSPKPSHSPNPSDSPKPSHSPKPSDSPKPSKSPSPGLYCGDVEFDKCDGDYKTDLKCCEHTDQCSGWGNCKCESTHCCAGDIVKPEGDDDEETDSDPENYMYCGDVESDKCGGDYDTGKKCCKHTGECRGWATEKCSSSHCCAGDVDGSNDDDIDCYNNKRRCARRRQVRMLRSM